MQPAEGFVYDMLTLEMVLVALSAHHQTCEIGAFASEGQLPGLGQGRWGRSPACEITLGVLEGEVQWCWMRAAQSHEVLLGGETAFTHLQACGPLSWKVRPFSSPAWFGPVGLREAPSPFLLDQWKRQVPPYCLVRFHELPLAALSHRQRQTLLLINGHRTVSELSEMLHCPPADLFLILTELEQARLITFARPTDRRPGS